MEIFLAIVVASAVILFGALISMGNERQRRAIDELREQTTLWAVQDLYIKREKLVRDVKIDDPQSWLNNIAIKVLGYNSNLQIVDVLDEPQALFCTSADGLRKIIFSPLAPSTLGRMRKRKHGQLNKDIGNPLLYLPKDAESYELSQLNGGFLFDLELEQVWIQLTGQRIRSTDRLWIYQYS